MILLKPTLFYCLILTSLFLCSCNHYYYAPNEGSLMALNEKNDIKVSFAGGGADSGESSSFQIGYSPIKHLGLQSSYFKLSEKRDMAHGKGYIFNGALGGYYFFPKGGATTRKIFFNEMQEGFLIDFYGGYAKGQVNNIYSQSTSSRFDFNKRFLQLGLHWQGRHVGVDFVLKNGNLDFSNGAVNGKVAIEHLQEIQDIQKYDTYDFRESSFRVHVGLRQVRIFCTITAFNSSKLGNVAFLDRTSHIGFILEIDEMFKKSDPTLEPFKQ